MGVAVLLLGQRLDEEEAIPRSSLDWSSSRLIVATIRAPSFSRRRSVIPPFSACAPCKNLAPYKTFMGGVLRGSSPFVSQYRE